MRTSFGFTFFSLGFLCLPAVAEAAGRPTATSQVVATNEDTARTITLSGTAGSGGTLTYTLNTTIARTRGTVSCTSNSCTYTPPANFNGTDTFYFQVTEGRVSSTWATVTVTVNAVNDAPTADNQTGVTVTEDLPRTIVLTGSDVEQSALSYQIVTSPTKGTATVTGSSVTYTPGTNNTGPDSFTFRAYDGAAYSGNATVSLDITSVNDRPTVSSQVVYTDEDTSITFDLSASDVDGDVLTPTFSGVELSGSTYTTANSTRGTFTVSGTRVTYTPPADFSGTDTFYFGVSDGVYSASSYATVTVNVAAVNDAPVATDAWARAANGQPAHLVLSAVDTEGDAVSFSIVTGPRFGSITLWNGDKVIYRPWDPASATTDSFTYRASDGSGTSEARTATIDVVPGVAPFPLDTVAVDDTLTTYTTADGNVVIELPSDDGSCEKTVTTQPRFEASLAGASAGYFGVVAGHYDTLTCGREDYEPEDTSIYLIGNDGTAGGFEARLLDVVAHVEAAGVSLDDGSLLFTRVLGEDLGAGLLRYTPGSASSSTTITVSVSDPLGVGSDSSPLYDPASGVTVMSTIAMPEMCGDAADNDCGALVSIDAAGNALDVLDEDDGHHAWGSAGCVEVYGYRYCGFGAGSDASGPDLTDLNACTVARLAGVPSPPSSTSTVADTLSLDTVFDPGDLGCTPVGTLESSIVNGGIISDGVYLYTLAYGSDESDGYARVAQLDTDLNVVETFEIPSSYSHSFTNGFHNSLLASADGMIYVVGTVDLLNPVQYAVVELDPGTGSVNYLVSEVVASDNQYGYGHLYVDGSGDEVIAYAVGETAVVTRLWDGAELAVYTLGAADSRYLAAPVLIDDGDGAGDALMFVSADNVVTIVPNTGLADDVGAPWAGPRRGGSMQARLP